MARTELGPSRRGNSSNANWQEPRGTCRPDKRDMVPESVNTRASAAAEPEGPRDSPLAYRRRRRHFGDWQVDKKKQKTNT